MAARDLMTGIGLTPKVSLALPVHNGAAFIDECIASILRQTFADFELIVCDNASTDDTCALVTKWCQMDPRVRLHRSSLNRGAAANFNWGFSLSRGQYFKWCAADDLLEPTFLSECVGALDADPGAVLAYTGTIDIDEDGKVLGEIFDNNFPYAFGSEDPVRRFGDLVCHEHSCVTVFGVARRRALEGTSLIAPFVGSDRLLLAELGLKGRFVRVPQNLFLHREHGGRSVKVHRRLQHRVSWFDPTLDRIVFPHFRLMWEYVRAAVRYSEGLRGRVRNVGRVLRWVYWYGWRSLLDDVTFYLPRRSG